MPAARPGPDATTAARDARRLSTLLEISQALSGTLNLKLALQRVYPFDHPVSLIHHPGLPDAHVFALSLAELDPGLDGKTVVVRRIGEPIQTDAQLMYTLRRAGVQPGSVVSVTESAGGVLVGSGGEAAELESVVASHVFVAKP